MRHAAVLASILTVLLFAPSLHAQIKATVQTATPVWTRGLQPISAESYYHAIECGKQGGARPACVFWDTDICKNEDFTLNWYSAYKQVAYEVWLAVQRKQPAPQPSYTSAQRTRVTIAVAQAKGARNPLTELRVLRGGKPAVPTERSVSGSGGGQFTFAYPAFAPTSAVTLELVGKERTLSCVFSPAVLRQMR